MIEKYVIQDKFIEMTAKSEGYNISMNKPVQTVIWKGDEYLIHETAATGINTASVKVNSLCGFKVVPRYMYKGSNFIYEYNAVYSSMIKDGMLIRDVSGRELIITGPEICFKRITGQPTMQQLSFFDSK